MGENKKNEELVMDAMNAVGLYKANQAGVYGNKDMDAQSIGNMGGVMTDVMIAEGAYQSGDISGSQYKDQVKEVIITGVLVFIDKALDKGFDVLTYLTTTYIPALTPVVTVARNFVKNLFYKSVDKVKAVAETAYEGVKSVATKLYDAGKKLFNKIIG